MSEHRAFGRYPVLWRWTPEGLTEEQALDDIADEYAVLAGDMSGGVMLMARYGDQWVCNPWSARPVIAELLRRLKS